MPRRLHKKIINLFRQCINIIVEESINDNGNEKCLFSENNMQCYKYITCK